MIAWAIAIGFPCGFVLALCVVEIVTPRKVAQWVDVHVLGGDPADHDDSLEIIGRIVDAEIVH